MFALRVLLILLLGLCFTARTEDISPKEMEDLKAEIERVRAELSDTQQSLGNRVTDESFEFLENRYGPNATVTTREGRFSL